MLNWFVLDIPESLPQSCTQLPLCLSNNTTKEEEPKKQVYDKEYLLKKLFSFLFLKVFLL